MILFDTTPLVALCDARDAYHERAVRHLKQLTPASFGVCEAVLAECCLHLPHPVQRLRLRALLDGLQVESAPLDAGDRADVFDWLARYAEHEPDWADACLAVLSARRADIQVWTYDREFRTTWRRPGGEAIPLAVDPLAPPR